MKILRAIVVEDEPSGLENLLWKLEQNCPEVAVVATASNGVDAIREIKRHLPDLLFLDIQLGDMTGFDVLKGIPYPSFELIFTTSYDEYAIDAIKNNALDYLLKPIMVEELMDSVAKAHHKLRQMAPLSPPAVAAPVLSSSQKFGFPVATGQQFIDLKGVIFAQADDNVAHLHLEDKQEIKITKSLAWLEEQLEGQGFCRIHHSYLVNLHHLHEYIRNDGGYVVMSNQKAISISRRRKDQFLEALEKWNG